MLQNYPLAYIVVSRLKKHAYGNTVSKLVAVPLVIENLVCVQNVQRRVRRYIKTTEVYEGKVNTGFCGFPKCENKAVGRAIWLEDNRMLELCSLHLASCTDPKLWKVVER